MRNSDIQSLSELKLEDEESQVKKSWQRKECKALNVKDVCRRCKADRPEAIPSTGGINGAMMMTVDRVNQIEKG